MRRRLIPPRQPFLGMGTAGSPYRIATAGQLADLATKVNSGATDTLRGGLYQDKHYLQVAHLDLGAYENFPMIGFSPQNLLFGVYNGNGFTLSNLNITNSSASLFFRLKGVIKNLGIESGTIQSTGAYAGIFATLSSGTISNCYNKATMIHSAPSGSSCGGIIGYTYNGAKAENCANYGEIIQNSLSGLMNTSGIMGTSAAGTSCEGCFASGRMSGTAEYVKRGISDADARVTNSYFDAEATTATTGDTALTTAQCTGAAAQTNMPNLDWVNVWRTNEDGYPTLRVFDK